MSTRSWWRSAEKKYQLKYKALSSFILKWDQLKPIVKKTMVVCTNNNTSTIVALFCPLLWFYVLFLNKQCRQRILQDFSSLPYDCEFADFFFLFISHKKTTTTPINSMLPSSVVRTKTGGTRSAYECVTNIERPEMTCSFIHYWTDWRQNEIYSFYTRKRKERLQTCQAPLDCSRIDIIQVTKATFPPFFFFSSLFNC